MVALIAALVKDSETEYADFGRLRDGTRLLPEKLVGLLEELRFGGLIRYQENQNGNPYGLIALTAEGRSWVDSFGDEAESMIARAPQQFKITAAERSTRRNGKRITGPSEATAG